MGGLFSHSITNEPVVENTSVTLADAPRPYDHLFKISLVGSSHTGKTKLADAIRGEIVSNHQYSETKGVDFTFYMYYDATHDEKIKYQIWDISGADKYTTIVKNYFRSPIILLVYTDIETLRKYLATHLNVLNAKVYYLITHTPGQDLTELSPVVVHNLNIIKHLSFDFTVTANRQELFMIISDCIGENKSSFKIAQTANVKKPAVYIYAPPGTELTVQLNTKYHITKEIPTRNNGIWACSVNSSSNLTVNGQAADYIYWEAEDITGELLTKLKAMYRFVIKRCDYQILSHVMGVILNCTEQGDFNDYWRPVFLEKPNEYMLITFVTEASFNEQFPLEFSLPVNLIRVELIFTELTQPPSAYVIKVPNVHKIKELYPGLARRYDVNEVTVVEWGGTTIE